MAGQTQPSPLGSLLQLPFASILTGINEVPPNVSTGIGVSLLGFDQALQNLRVLLVVSTLPQTTVAHIHVGRPGQNGPIVLFLFGPTMPTNITAPTVLTNRSFTAADLTGPLAGMPLSALAQQMETGNAYVNVHTVSHPNGEIRGQIFRRF